MSKLNRTIKQWRNCDPKAMAQMSEAAIIYAFQDARADILMLHAENEILRNKPAHKEGLNATEAPDGYIAVAMTKSFCKECAFYHGDDFLLHIDRYKCLDDVKRLCLPSHRSDGLWVTFKKVE